MTHSTSAEHGQPDQSELLDLDAVVLGDHLADITDWLPLRANPERIVDLGCGTGAGALALLDRFPNAEVVAVDASPAHLSRLSEKARDRGVLGRLNAVRADLDEPEWPDLGNPDLVWASASMHHMADPARVLRRVREILSPNGLFAVVELAGLPRFLPENAPADRPGLEERCHRAGERFRAEHVPLLGADWTSMLTEAGFTIDRHRTFRVNRERAQDEAVSSYALRALQELRRVVTDVADPADLAALDRLIDTDGPHSVLGRDDLVVRTERQVWAAR